MKWMQIPETLKWHHPWHWNSDNMKHEMILLTCLVGQRLRFSKTRYMHKCSPKVNSNSSTPRHHASTASILAIVAKRYSTTIEGLMLLCAYNSARKRRARVTARVRIPSARQQRIAINGKCDTRIKRMNNSQYTTTTGLSPTAKQRRRQRIATLRLEQLRAWHNFYQHSNTWVDMDR